MTRRHGSPGRRAPRFRGGFGSYWGPSYVETVEPAGACCACCGNYTTDPTCRACAPLRNVGEDATAPSSSSSSDGAKAAGAGAGVVLVVLALLLSQQDRAFS